MPKIVLGIIATKVKINANSHDDDFTPPFDRSCLPSVHTPAPLQGGCVIVVVLHVLLKCYGTLAEFYVLKRGHLHTVLQI